MLIRVSSWINTNISEKTAEFFFVVSRLQYQFTSQLRRAFTQDLDRQQYVLLQGDTKKRELLKNPTKIEEIQEKKSLTEIEPLQLAF